MTARLGKLLQQASDAMAAGDHAAAERLCRRILKQDRRNSFALAWLGIALSALDRVAEAEPVFRRAAEAEPRNPGAQLNLGNAQMRLGMPERAAASFERALGLQPDFPEALNSMGALMVKRGALAAGVTRIRAALASRPDYPEALDNLGDALLRSGEREQAVEAFRRAAALDPGNAGYRCDLARALMELERSDEALSIYRDAIAAHPENAGVHSNLGAALNELGRHAEAVPHFERALALEPGLGDAQYNRGLARLHLGDFENGWMDYERRLELRDRPIPFRDDATLDRFMKLRRWAGPGEAGVGEVAVWTEQGIGDQLLYSTLIPELAATGVRLVCEVDRRLAGAYERAIPQARFVAYSDPPHEALERADRVLMVGSLPRYLRRARRDFARQPAKLLSAVPALVTRYREQLAQRGAGLKVALSWRSARKDRLGPRKSAPLMAYLPLLRLPGVTYVDVQYGDTDAERTAAEQAAGAAVTRLPGIDYFNDLEDLLAILEACDLVLTTSNVTVHLAGALGKRAWLLLPPGGQAPFHYWAQREGPRSLWYPSVEIFSDPRAEDWEPLLARVGARLQAAR